jgi:hypothetical protein
MWAKLPLTQVTTVKLDAWVRHMHSEGVGANTITGVVNLFGAMLAAAVRHEKIPANPKTNMGPLPTVVKPKKRSATREEIDAIMAASKPRIGSCGS